jgi:hypothetical protein
VRFLDYDLDLNTPHGEMIITMAAAFAQMESRLKQERVKAVMDYKRSKGHALNQHPTPGNRIVKHNGVKVQAPDRKLRTLIRCLWMLRTQWAPKGLRGRSSLLGFHSARQASERLEAILAKREGRKPVPWCNNPKLSSERVIKKWFNRLKTMTPDERAAFWRGEAPMLVKCGWL